MGKTEQDAIVRKTYEKMAEFNTAVKQCANEGLHVEIKVDLSANNSIQMKFPFIKIKVFSPLEIKPTQPDIVYHEGGGHD